MNTIECMKTRRSVRVFKADKVSRQILEQVVDAASFAPSWKNTQITRYIVIDDPILKHQIALKCCEGFNQDTVNSAPALVVTTLISGRSGYERDGSFSTSKKSEWQYYDCGIAGGLFSLAAHELGLACVIVGIFDFDKAAELIGIPEGQEIMSFIPIGYPDESPMTPKKKTVTDLISYR